MNTIYPDLAVGDSSGTIQVVRYDEGTSLLLAQVQRMDKKPFVSSERAAAQTPELAAMKAQKLEIKQLNQSMQLALRQV